MKIENEEDSLKRINHEEELMNEFIGTKDRNVSNNKKSEYKLFIHGFLEYVATKHNLVLTKSEIKLNC